MNSIQRGERRYYLTQIRLQERNSRALRARVIKSKFLVMVDSVLFTVGITLIVGLFLWVGQ